MKRTYWILGACLSLLLVGGLALDVSAQQQPPPATAPSTPSTPDPSTSPSTPPSPPSGTMQRDNPSATMPPAAPDGSRLETRDTPRAPGAENGRIFGLAPGVALLIGAALLVVIVIALVAMSKKSDEVIHTHRV
ncbi:MAG TPA: hypothetical protein VJU81_12725 [Methylomirabilota bacterium]|nr:hypothetical protein [Methylomirabilota bacterium]